MFKKVLLVFSLLSVTAAPLVAQEEQQPKTYSWKEAALVGGASFAITALIARLLLEGYYPEKTVYFTKLKAQLIKDLAGLTPEQRLQFVTSNWCQGLYSDKPGLIQVLADRVPEIDPNWKSYLAAGYGGLTGFLVALLNLDCQGQRIRAAKQQK